DQDARAIARVGVASTSSAMIQVVEQFHRHVDDVVAGLSLDVADEADAARVVLESWIIESLGLGAVGPVGASPPALVGMARAGFSHGRGCIRSLDCPEGALQIQRDELSPSWTPDSRGPKLSNQRIFGGDRRKNGPPKACA